MRAIIKRRGKPPVTYTGVKEVRIHHDGSIGIVLHKKDKWLGLTGDMKPEFFVHRRYCIEPGVKIMVRE